MVRFFKLSGTSAGLIVAAALAAGGSACTDVDLFSMAPEPPPVIEGVKPSTFALQAKATTEFRLAFVVDMSNSMFSGPCIDSIDTMIPGVAPVDNCLGPSGVDPAGNRFAMIDAWLEDLESKIAAGLLERERVEIVIIPFSNSSTEGYWARSSVNEALTDLGVEIPAGFVKLSDARLLNAALRAMFARYHDHPISADIPPEVARSVHKHFRLEQTTHPSSGTSIVAPAIQKLANLLDAELSDLEQRELLSATHAEIVFLSDGVPKPHALHIEAAVRFVWRIKQDVFDDTLCGERKPVEGSPGSYYCTNWVVDADASACPVRCRDTLAVYADTGALDIPSAEETPDCIRWYHRPRTCREYSNGARSGQRWAASHMTCGQCFTLLRHFDVSYGKCYPYRRSAACRARPHDDRFSAMVKDNWGDWTLNRHAQIIGDLKSIEGLFRRQYRGPIWRFNFLRVDAVNPAFKTQSGELAQALNWIERAKDHFARQHRFTVVSDGRPPFPLFEELAPEQSYRLGQIYLYARNVRMDRRGKAHVDSDGDGLADHDEGDTDSLEKRTNGYCLDSIVRKYGCFDAGCDPRRDDDADGLNECEEITVGTDDYEVDSDGDGLIDAVEVLFGMHPSTDDQHLATSPDGLSNFEHFVRGFGPSVDLRQVGDAPQIDLSVDLIGRAETSDGTGQVVELPRYVVEVEDLPIVPTRAVPGGSAAGVNAYVLIVRLDNPANPFDTRWLFQVYRLSDSNAAIEVDLAQLKPLALDAP
jgi:hypothetical protein